MSSWNIEFCEIFPAFSLKTMNLMERNFLSALSWEMYIKGSVYASYYFGLRALRNAQPGRMPRHFQRPGAAEVRNMKVCTWPTLGILVIH